MYDEENSIQRARRAAQKMGHFRNEEIALRKIEEEKENKEIPEDLKTKYERLIARLEFELDKVKGESEIAAVDFRNARLELDKMKDSLEFERLKYQKEYAEKIETRGQEFVNEAHESLKSKEKWFHMYSKIWSAIGLLSLMAGCAGIIFINSPKFLAQLVNLFGDSHLLSGVLISVKNVAFVGIIFGIAKYCFITSKSYMHESLKNSERIHAIYLGKFYLGAFGVQAEWKQIKAVFENWNINASTAFSSQNLNQIEPKFLEQMLGGFQSIREIKEIVEKRNWKEQKEATMTEKESNKSN